MKPILAIFLFTASFAPAEPVLAPPQIGFVLDQANAVRAVFGIAGNFSLGDSLGADSLGRQPWRSVGSVS